MISCPYTPSPIRPNSLFVTPNRHHAAVLVLVDKMLSTSSHTWDHYIQPAACGSRLLYKYVCCKS